MMEKQTVSLDRIFFCYGAVSLFEMMLGCGIAQKFRSWNLDGLSRLSLILRKFALDRQAIKLYRALCEIPHK